GRARLHLALALTLLVTPVRNLFNVNLIKYRRAIGLLAFFYTCLHLLTYLWLDQQWGWGAILKDITKRPYIIIGMLAFLGLVPLAVTSNNASIRRLGAAGWRKLHTLVYPVAVFGAVHYLLLVKAWPPAPIVYLGLIVILLAYRFLKLQRRRVAA
ncbi:MAG: protein-methionine-sulfoxide reductase heme-binding subunit MsrQ, partial [Haliea sp.]